MGNEELTETVKRLGDTLEKSRCLCVGAGATVAYVGTWGRLLGTMLGTVFRGTWEDEHRGKSASERVDDISEYREKDYFADFFAEESYLDKGEFLLASAKHARVANPDGDVAEHEERFSAMVEAIIRRRIADKLGEQCSWGGLGSCGKVGDCPLAKDDGHTLANTFKAYQLFCSMSREGDGRKNCMLAGGIDTTMAVVELCATGKIQHVINYNFDLVIEEALAQVIESDLLESPSSPISEIHIWKYGPSEVKRTLNPGARCSVVLHQGRWKDDFEALGAPGSIHFYHVHGVASGPTIRDASGRLVLSQHSYEEYQSKPLNWSNQVLGQLLSRYDVVGIGFSGIDANYRHFASLHHKASRDPLFGEAPRVGTHKRTVLLKAREPYRKEIEKSTGKRAADDAVVGTFLQYCCTMVKNYYRGHYQIDTVWVDDYTDVAEAVHQVALG